MSVCVCVCDQTIVIFTYYITFFHFLSERVCLVDCLRNIRLQKLSLYVHYHCRRHDNHNYAGFTLFLKLQGLFRTRLSRKDNWGVTY